MANSIANSYLLTNRFLGINKILDLAGELDFFAEFFGKTFVLEQKAQADVGAQPLKGRLIKVKKRSSDEKSLHYRVGKVVFAVLVTVTIVLPLISLMIKFMHKDQILALQQDSKDQEPQEVLDKPSENTTKTSEKHFLNKLSEVFEDKEISQLIREKFSPQEIKSFTCGDDNRFEISSPKESEGVIGSIEEFRFKFLQGATLQLKSSIKGTFSKKERESSFNFDAGCVKLSYSLFWKKYEYNLTSLSLKDGYPDGIKRFVMKLQSTSDPTSRTEYEVKVSTVLSIFKNFTWK